VYACECSRREIANRVGARHAHGAGPVGEVRTSVDGRSAPGQGFGEDAARGDWVEVPYDGHCRTRGLLTGPGRGLRVALPHGVERFDDVRLGAQAQEPARQCGDVLLVDREGCFTYQLAVTVDDIVHGIDFVVRGEDLLESTGRQIALARLLGRAEPPRFFHHPLLKRSDGQKLSKSDGETGIRELRTGGWSALEVIGRARA
jgi:glutamyl/glutaminyl-tRNA synthetase